MCNNIWLIIIIWFLFSGNGCSFGTGCGGCDQTVDNTVNGCGCHNDCGCQNDCVRVVGNGGCGCGC